MRTFLALFAICPVFAAAQVTVQEYPVPPGHRVHDEWADAAPLGPGSSPHGVIAGPDTTVIEPPTNY
jgi:streptogramin lyase